MRLHGGDGGEIGLVIAQTVLCHFGDASRCLVKYLQICFALCLRAIESILYMKRGFVVVVVAVVFQGAQSS